MKMTVAVILVSRPRIGFSGVKAVGGRQNGGVVAQVKGDVVREVDGNGEVVARRKHNGPAARSMGGDDGVVDRWSIKGSAISHCSVVFDIE